MKDTIKLLDLSQSKLDITLGYEYIYSPNHPLANKSGKVYTHRYLYSLYHNQYVTEDEIVHHIDENKRNNSIDNLEKLSNSEHTKLHNPQTAIQENICLQCKKLFLSIQRYEHTYCSQDCFKNFQIKNNRKFDPSKEELEHLIWQMSSVKLAQHYGVSDKAIEKRCKLFNIQKPPRGYWATQSSHRNLLNVP